MDKNKLNLKRDREDSLMKIGREFEGGFRGLLLTLGRVANQALGLRK